MNRIEMRESWSLARLVTVKQVETLDDYGRPLTLGDPVDLTGATLAAIARSRDPGVEAVEPATALVSAVNGVLSVSLAPWALSPGAWELEVAATLDGHTEGVYSAEIRVLKSYLTPPA